MTYTMERKVLDAGLPDFWLGRGLNIIPLQPDSKRPIMDWGAFCHERVTDEQIREWWGRFPEANVGVVCGAVNKLVVLDCDGAEAVALAQSIGLPETVCVKTPNGMHFYLSIPDGCVIKTVPQGGLNLVGCELKGEGSYVVAPPSSVGGVPYYFVNPLEAGFADLRTAPMDVIFGPQGAGLVLPRGRGAANIPPTFGEKIMGVRLGERNASIASVVGSLFRAGAGFAEGLAIALAVNEKNLPPLEEQEVRMIANSIFTTHVKNFSPPKGGERSPLVTHPPDEEGFVTNTHTQGGSDMKNESHVNYPVKEDVSYESSTRRGGIRNTHTQTNCPVKEDVSYESFGDQANWLPVGIKDLPRTTPIEWIVEGYAARGRITELVGIWKSGKTTLISAILKEMAEGGEIAGKEVKKGKALVISEETTEEWKDREARFKFGDNVKLVCQPFKIKPTMEQWLRFIEVILQNIQDTDLIVVDSIATLWPVVNENDSSLVLEALLPLTRWTRAGKALLLVHHPKKTDATEGRTSRGSGGLPAYVDILMEFRRYGREGTTKRTITAYSRRLETPPSLVLDYQNGRYMAIGEEVEDKERKRTILEMLREAPDGLTREQIFAGLAEGLKPTKQTLWRDLKAMILEGKAQVTGNGTRTMPYVYRTTEGGENVKRAKQDRAISQRVLVGSIVLD